ncbi:MAG: hypothetical protein AB1730_04880 [Myxococcota bacterium]|jgi:hypothetical protein
MQKNTWLGLGVVLGAVLAAALMFALRGGEPTPVGDAPSGPARADGATSPPPPFEPGAVPEVGRPEEAAPDEPSEPGSPDPHQPVGVVEPTRTEEPPPPLADDPFTTENSRELDYAFQLVFGPDSSVDSAKAAAEVFEKCLKAAPENRRCYDGLVAAQQRQQPGWTPPPPVTPLAGEPTNPAPRRPQPTAPDHERGRPTGPPRPAPFPRE